MDGTVFAFDPDWVSTLNAPFMTNAFLGLCIALAAGVMGYFTIARHSTFAAHALAHIGLPGATGAVLLGLPVSAGLGVFALGGALVIGALGKKASQREIATGTVLAFATGLGLFFARMSSPASQQMQSILFGSILTITDSQIIGFAIFDVLLLAVLAVIYRPLLFSSLDGTGSAGKRRARRFYEYLFYGDYGRRHHDCSSSSWHIVDFRVGDHSRRHRQHHCPLAIQGDGRRHGNLPDFDLGRTGAFHHVSSSTKLHYCNDFNAVLGDRESG